MARFNDAWLDMLLSKNDIVSVVSSYVTLRSKGKRLWGLCPFHGEKTPSFSVSPDRQVYHCFGCGAGGGVVQFVMEMERLPFVEAVGFLAQRAGLELPNTVDDEAIRQERARKERLYEALKEAARYYHERLLGAEGEGARAYLAGRGLSAAVVRHFGLGYAPEGWQNASEHLKNAGFHEDELIEAGLLVRNPNSGRVYDAYRNRVIFPIIGTNARVLGFGARAMGDDMPKYINTGETPVYSKSRNLYALNSAKKERGEDIIVVEGYMDVISLFCAGIRNVVASLGTALTAQQARLIKRYASNVYIAYDGDSAGQNATVRGLDILQAEGLHVRVIVLPDGLDPDDFVRRNAKEDFDALRENALALNAFKLMRMADGFDLATEDGRQAYAMAGCAFIAGLQPVEQERYYQALARGTGISVEALKAQGALQKPRAGQAYTPDMPGEMARRRGSEERTERQHLERSLMQALIEHPFAAPLVGEAGGPELFTSEAYREFFKLLQELGGSDVPRLMNMLESGHAKQIAGLVSQDAQIAEPEPFVRDCILRIRRTECLDDMDRLKRRAADETITLEEKLALMREIGELKKRI